MSKLRLFVVRHGETAWVRERRFAGSRDIPITETGRHQCAAVGRALTGSAVAAVYASPLERARASAEVIAQPLGLPVRIAAAFSEMDFGAWEGLTLDEVRARFPEAWEQWRSAPHLCKRSDAEALPDVAERVAAGVETLRVAHAGQSVVLVSHAIVARVIVLGALGLGLDRLWTLDAAPAGITEIEYEPGWATVHRMNTVAHLEGAAT
ncbi:MAG: histidine phosphatase family protein [Candidatus Rokuibacteriota bacterium]|nr:MAG: histidine phosphatase family protein [Candidatus Rokubacteria bacterium]